MYSLLSLRKVATLTTCGYMLLWICPSVATSGSSQEDDMVWLEDFDTFPENEEMLADSPVREPSDFVSGECPPIPDDITPESCAVIECTSDRDCASETNTKCCSNGCVMTCQPIVEAPSYVDWQRNPPAMSDEGSHWLMAGDSPSAPVQWCSTTFLFANDNGDENEEENVEGDDLEDDENVVTQPYLCPPGYVCHIDHPEDNVKQTPNRGHCVPDEEESHDEDTVQIRWRHGVDRHTCRLRNALIENGKEFIYKNHLCSCGEGYISCNVSADAG